METKDISMVEACIINANIITWERLTPSAVDERGNKNMLKETHNRTLSETKFANEFLWLGSLKHSLQKYANLLIRVLMVYATFKFCC